MKREEIIQIFKILKSAYPRFYLDMSRDEMIGAVNLWTDMFKNDDCQVVTTAVKELINGFQYPPTIADIKNKMDKLTDTESKQAIDYWNELKRIVANGNYGAVEGFEHASEPVKRFLHNPSQIKELALMDENTFNSVTKGQFLKQVESIIAEEKENRTMLPETKALINGLASNLSLENRW